MNTTTDNRIIQPYLFFNGNCEEAVKFYQQALGAEVQMMMRYKESPEPPSPDHPTPPNWGDKIMHTSFKIGDTVVMASDGCDEKNTFEGFSLSITVPDEADADRVFAALCEGGQVRLPLTKTFWSPRFGMLQDKFGVGWMVGVMPANA